MTHAGARMGSRRHVRPSEPVGKAMLLRLRTCRCKPERPFRSCNSSPTGIRLAVMMDIRLPRPLRNVGDLLFERGSISAIRRETGWVFTGDID